MIRKRSKLVRVALILAVILLLGVGSIGLAQNGMLHVDWWTVDGGGGTASGGIYSVSGTIGQPEAGGISSGGPYSISGGFWGPATDGPDLFLPFIGWR